MDFLSLLLQTSPTCHPQSEKSQEGGKISARGKIPLIINHNSSMANRFNNRSLAFGVLALVKLSPHEEHPVSIPETACCSH